MDVGRLSVGAEIQELLAALVKEEEKEDDVVARSRGRQRTESERRGEDRSIFPFSRFFISSESH